MIIRNNRMDIYAEKTSLELYDILVYVLPLKKKIKKTHFWGKQKWRHQYYDIDVACRFDVLSAANYVRQFASAVIAVQWSPKTISSPPFASYQKALLLR